MDTNETPMVEATAPTEPPPNGKSDEHASPEVVRLLLDAGRMKAAVDAIGDWAQKAHHAAELAQNAADDEHGAMLRATAGNEAARKAEAKLKSSTSRLRAEHAAIEARAAERLVDLLVGGGRS